MASVRERKYGPLPNCAVALFGNGPYARYSHDAPNASTLSRAHPSRPKISKRGSWNQPVCEAKTFGASFFAIYFNNLKRFTMSCKSTELPSQAWQALRPWSFKKRFDQALCDAGLSTTVPQNVAALESLFSLASIGFLTERQATIL